jgi:DNA adenine methylase
MVASPAVTQLSMAFDLPVATAKSFLKWAGGKGQLLDQFAPLYPKDFTNYHEPFVGSAAVFFHLYGLGRLSSRTTQVRLTDSNSELINCYQTVRDDVDGLIDLLTIYRQQHSQELYYKIRSQIPTDLTPLERAARFIYLNKTCYNGLYRVNRKGQFNVPMGSYKNPRIFEPEELVQAARALTGVELVVADFHDVLNHAKAGDYIYFDPPYYPLTQTANFTCYTENAFGEEQQRDLAQVFRKLDRMGGKVMLSNSWAPFILDLYQGFKLIEVKAARVINSKPDRRGKISELVVLNYEPTG